MEATKRAIKFQLNESKKSLITFWSVIIIIDILSIGLSRISNISIGLTNISIGINSDGYGQGMNIVSLMALNFIPILIYHASHAYELYYKNFPISLSFSVTRKDFFKSMIANNILVITMASIIQSILMTIDPIIVKLIGKEPFYEFGVFNTQTDNILYVMVSMFIIFTLFVAFWNLIAAFNYRFGPKFWIFLGITTFLTEIIFNFNLINDFLFPEGLASIRIDILQFTRLSIISIIIYIVVYFVTINTNVKNKA